MINYEDISRKVLCIKRKYQETDLDRLCRDMGITVIDHNTTMSVEDFKGMSMVQCRIPVILLNSKLKEDIRQVVLAHEIGHVVLHRQLTALRGFHDFDLFGMNDHCEYEANVFAAELILDNEEVLDVLNQDMSFFGAAKTLCVPPELLDFKFRVLKQQGYSVNPPLIANGSFLRRMESNEC
jgi:Zn-dependent peptidase ImmA (M78 family)